MALPHNSSMKPGIVIPAFLRPGALKRLLDSVESAVYPDDVAIELYISLDGGADRDVLRAAEDFVFTHGNKTVITREENIGLREHLLWCGDQSEKFGSVVILEDDLYVDPHFYLFASKALEYYQAEPSVSGIALYSPRHNEYAGLPFEPLYDYSSVFFMQVPCSWGQAWTARQWQGFRNWSENKNEEHLQNILALPDAVKNWPESSWKKYFAAYLVETDRMFVYPYHAYSTNCSDDGGTHINSGIDFLQVPLPKKNRVVEQFNFQAIGTGDVKYDSFMEPFSNELFNQLALSPEEVEIDFYGIKPLELLKNKKYVLTSRRTGSCLKCYKLSFKPLENLTNLEAAHTKDNCVCLTHHASVEESNESFKHLAKYFSYFPVFSKRMLRAFGEDIVSRVFKKN